MSDAGEVADQQVKIKTPDEMDDLRAECKKLGKVHASQSTI